jgi:hypothetical protein
MLEEVYLVIDFYVMYLFYSWIIQAESLSFKVNK